MTRFTVVWRDEALDELLEIWFAATTNRSAVSVAAHRIDTELANDPSSKGSAVDAEFRSLTIDPLWALFSVRELDRLASVAKVKLIE
jgi:hypothetical protein